ncbi:hypothetical protein OJF2_41830 [Aquisphaera giovannonii]|uniref:HTH cro/C1-type domain-containing protein n=1 Tax=Aquisphaera giovannonii TaxID=406548 RepID=A0A5B9W6N2_9BACT|nr:XRE family transcriptional regulator [Aquisphaera giovannonii]QEH35630.1 hypothetical protein OJF2_41830 [Aquisphaera giovannonii]
MIERQRPHQGSGLASIKERRVQYQDDPWRLLFAFDPNRAAIPLIGGNKRATGAGTGPSSPSPTSDSAGTSNAWGNEARKTTRLEDDLATLPAAEQQAVRDRAAELIAEEATLRQLREAREQTQAELAKTLHVNQAAISRLERRSDMDLSTLRGFIEAMGGQLEIVARFPDRSVRINPFEALDPELRPEGETPDTTEGADFRIAGLPHS